MRIAMVTPGFPPFVGGVELHVERLSIELQALGHDVTVLTPQRSRRPATSLPTIHRGVRVLRFSNSMGTEQFPVAPSLGWHLRRHAARYDVVHAHSFHASAALVAAVGSRLPLVFTPHYHGVGHTPVAKVMHAVYDRPAAVLFRRAGAVLCVSSTEAGQLAEDYPCCADRISVVPNGVDVIDLRRAEPFGLQRPTILVAGRLEEYKQVHVAIEALSQLDEDVQLVVTGTGPEANRLSEMARRLGLEDRVRLTGAVPAEELRRWQRSAAAVVTLSRHEAFGLTLLEGAVAGAKVIASDIPAHREVAGLVPDAVRFVPATPGIGDVAAALRQALSEPAPASDCDRVPTWPQVAALVAERYRSAIAAGGLTAPTAA